MTEGRREANCPSFACCIRPVRYVKKTRKAKGWSLGLGGREAKAGALAYEAERQRLEPSLTRPEFIVESLELPTEEL